MLRRNFLVMLSSLPFLGGLKPKLPPVDSKCTLIFDPGGRTLKQFMELDKQVMKVAKERLQPFADLREKDTEKPRTVIEYAPAERASK